MTEKLYDNAYLKEFDAEVLSCEEKNGKFAVVLSRTAFFPEGGGQAADLGVLGEAEVLDVQECDGVIVHTVSAPLAGCVHGVIDWETRFERMQNHTGEHLVSGIIHEKYGYNNVGFHMGADCLTFDFDGPLSLEQAAEVEALANRAVYENRAVTVSYPEHPEELEYRSKLDLSEGVRIVTVEGYDVCACCAPHVASTGEIGCIKILDVTPHKGGVRITMICGKTAYNDYCGLHADVRKLMKLLSAPRDGVVEAVEKLLGEISAAKGEISALKADLAKSGLEVTQIGAWAVGFLPEAGFDALRSIINGLSDGTALFALSGEYMVRGEGAGDLTRALNAAFSGKGGGKPNFTQGKLVGEQDAITKFFEEMNA
ncbi:MAG: hypothetical protein IJC88_04785 [Oscillospiraceae bacterium]|nr:hypothetical protein [Oscillospiraceae bacterium]